MRSHLPFFETKRFLIREVMEKDLYDMYEYSKIREVGYNAGWEPHISLSYTKEVIKMFRKKYLYSELGIFAIVIKQTGKMIGTCELHNYTKGYKAELGYTVNPAFQNQGVATEVSKALLEWGFTDLGLKRIECNCLSDNLKSKRVCEKLLFNYEGLKKNGYQLFDGTIHDLECFGMTDTDFRRIKENNLWKEID